MHTRSLRFLAVLAISVASIFTIRADAQQNFGRPRLVPVKPLPPQVLSQLSSGPPVVALQVQNFKLLTATTGWASTENRLLWTTDGGTHWKDISPPKPKQSFSNFANAIPEDQYADVFFLDADNGWVLISAAPPENQGSEAEQSQMDGGTWEENCAFFVAATNDGGKTWTIEPVEMPEPSPAGSATPILSGNGNFTFTDTQHGWLELENQTGSAFSDGDLMVTSDGGRTWQMSQSNPDFYGEIRATPNGDLWILGGADDDLAVRHKDEKEFNDFSLPVPNEVAPATAPMYTLPIFDDSSHGYEAVTYLADTSGNSSAVLYETTDGGRTWKANRRLSNISATHAIYSTVVDSIWIIPSTQQNAAPSLTQLESNEVKKAAANYKPNSSSNDLTNPDFSFLTPDAAWSRCSGGLCSTIDGGTTWTVITPEFETEC